MARDFPQVGESPWAPKLRAALVSMDQDLETRLGVDPLTEFVRDLIGATLVGGTNVTVTVNDAGNTVTLSASGPNPAVFARYVTVSTGNETRPSGVGLVVWIGGSTQPTNMLTGDVWLAAGVPAPTTAPNITTTSLSGATVAVAFSQTLSATGTTPITWAVTAGALPAGLSLNATTGAITGTPTTSGAFSFTITATNAAGSDTQAFSGSVAAAATAPNITTTTIAAMTQGSAYSQALAATGTAPITWGISAGALPAGLAINSSTGALSGTPTVSGAYSFTVQATNSVGSDTQAFSGTITASSTPPTITTTTLNAMTVGSAFSQALAATGSTPITWGVTAGTLPAGLALNTSAGAITGTPTTAGAYSFTVTATNSAGSDPQAYSGTVAAEAGPLSVFGSAAPGTGSSIFNDGGGTLRVGNSFYGTKPIRITGVRVWNPPTADSTFLDTDLTVFGYARDYLGSIVMSAPTWGSPTQSAAHTATRVAGTWTDILFPAPITLNAISPSANSPDFVTVAVEYAGGNYYVVATGATTPSGTESTMEPGVFLAESDFRVGTQNGPGESVNTTYYGLDILFEVV